MYKNIIQIILLTLHNYERTVIQSLKQNEWDVEIITEICGDKVYTVPEYILDEDGHITLKAIIK